MLSQKRGNSDLLSPCLVRYLIVFTTTAVSVEVRVCKFQYRHRITLSFFLILLFF